MNLEARAYLVEPLAEKHVRSVFSCGIEALDRYLRQQAGQDQRRNVAVVYVMRREDSTEALGFYTLANTSIDLSELPPAHLKKLPRYPQVPATLLGRLAIDLKVRGRGLGEFLLLDAMKRTLQTSAASASFALVVDPKDQAAKSFYQLYGFEELHGETRLFLALTEIERFLARPKGGAGL